VSKLTYFRVVQKSAFLGQYLFQQSALLQKIDFVEENCTLNYAYWFCNSSAVICFIVNAGV
jgi:hypothetical protein